MEIKPIAYIRTDFKEKFGIPRQSGRVESLTGKIIFENEFKNGDAIRGIEDFSHLWLIFGFSENEQSKVPITVRPPRLGGNKRMGVFATRAPFRPNSLGLSVVKLERIEKNSKEGNVLIVSGVDILDNTPVFDIKPYIPHADCKKDAKGGFSDEFCDYCLDVEFPENLLSLIPEEKQKTVIDCLKEDPRPSYHNDTRQYSMNFAGFDINFRVFEKKLTVISVNDIGDN